MSFFLRRVNNHAEAEDLTQEVFAKLLGRTDETIDSPDSYVFQTAANLLRDRARRAQVRRAYSEAVSVTEGLGVELLDPHRIAAGRDDLAALRRGLMTLPERTRTIFVLYRIENLSLDDIAVAFGISKSAVKQHVMKAMASLMAFMRERA
jgi:RNA polymerase sigma factor (sigma-70 family)